MRLQRCSSSWETNPWLKCCIVSFPARYDFTAVASHCALTYWRWFETKIKTKIHYTVKIIHLPIQITEFGYSNHFNGDRCINSNIGVLSPNICERMGRSEGVLLHFIIFYIKPYGFRMGCHSSSHVCEGRSVNTFRNMA